MVSINPEFINMEAGVKPLKTSINTLEGPYRAKLYEYEKDNSPFKYRSYLTFSTEPTFAQSQILKSEFWIAEVMQTFATPLSYLNKAMHQNKFYKRKATGFGTVTGVVGILGVIGLAAILQNAE